MAKHSQKNFPKKSNEKVAITFSSLPGKNYSAWLICFALLLTIVAYIPALNAGFVNWDDDDYTVKSTIIRHLDNIKALVTTPVQGNYHPLTMLSLALNYSISELKPWSYHFLNILFHASNVILVYILALRLSKGSDMVAFTTALLFGVHPMHVESVAWVSERKDVLYAFFFLLGLLSYLKYSNTGSRISYVSAILWFALSLASKPAAIIFPVVLFTIDFLWKRKLSVKIFAEKLPFFLFAAVMAYLTLNAQNKVGATDTAEAFGLGRRILFVFYGYMMYFLKMIFPFNLCTLYPFPPVNESLPSTYYISIVFFVFSAVVCGITFKKYPVISFGFAFYLINLLMILQFFIVGSAVIADRYAYIPYIGLFFVGGWLLDKKFSAKPERAYYIVAVIGIAFTMLSYKQAATWKSSDALWDQAIKVMPGSKAYTNRALVFRKAGNTDKALACYNEAIRLNKVDQSALCNRGNIYFNKGMDSLALADYNHALFLKPDYINALDCRGALFSRQKKFDLGLADLNKALTLRPDYEPSYLNRAITLFSIGEYENAIRDFNIYLTYKPDNADIYNSIGVCYQNLKRHDLSIQPFNDAIRMMSKPVFYINRAYSFHALGKMHEACKDVVSAREGGAQVPPELLHFLGM